MKLSCHASLDLCHTEGRLRCRAPYGLPICPQLLCDKSQLIRHAGQAVGGLHEDGFGINQG